jgi:tetratricopeptide (TPR) repeat protein
MNWPKKYFIQIFPELFLLVGLVIGCGHADDYYRHGEQLIDLNCAECVGASKKGIEEGIAQINKALSRGYPDKGSAYKVLAEAYNTLVVAYSAPGSDERRRYRENRQRSFEKALELSPNDAALRFKYALTLDNTSAQKSALEEVIRRTPTYPDAHFVLGMLLTENGKVDDGVKELETAVQLAPSDDAKTYGRRLIYILNENGRSDEAQKVQEQLDRKNTHSQ